MEKRKLAELEFWDDREGYKKRRESLLFNKKALYATVRSIWVRLNKIVEKKISKNSKILDYGCGLGEVTLSYAKKGINVTGIDISKERIKLCKDNAKKLGIEKYAKYYAMDAEHSKFKNNSFDIILCCGVLHHLDIKNVFKELSRLLKKDGIIICVEPLKHNILFQLYRKITPKQRTEWEAEHILGMKDINFGKRYFKNINIYYYHLFTICAFPFYKTPLFKSILRVLEWIDAVILRIPVIQKLAWQVLFVLSNKR